MGSYLYFKSKEEGEARGSCCKGHSLRDDAYMDEMGMGRGWEGEVRDCKKTKTGKTKIMSCLQELA